MTTVIQLRRGDAAAWTDANPTLHDGELGVEHDTGKAKLGDGLTAWADLPYSFPGTGSGQAFAFVSLVSDSHVAAANELTYVYGAPADGSNSVILGASDGSLSTVVNATGQTILVQAEANFYRYKSGGSDDLTGGMKLYPGQSADFLYTAEANTFDVVRETYFLQTGLTPDNHTWLAPADRFLLALPGGAGDYAIPAYSYNNGTLGGQGATLTATANGALQATDANGDLGGVTAGERIVFYDATGSPANSGVYLVTTVGDGGSPWVLTRALDNDTADELLTYWAVALQGDGITSTFKVAYLSGGDTVGATAVDMSVALFNADARGYTSAIGYLAHAEGGGTIASETFTHAEGSQTLASAPYAHAEGADTQATGPVAHAEGGGTLASGDVSHAEGENTQATAEATHAEGEDTQATAEAAHAEGAGTLASGIGAHAEGTGTIASAEATHAEGSSTTASAASAHAEGDTTVASGSASHAEGSTTFADGDHSHAEGTNTHARGLGSHAEGSGALAYLDNMHAEAGGVITTIGDSQFSRHTARGQTTSSAGLVLLPHHDFVDGDGNPTFIRTVIYTIRLVARRIDIPGTDSAWVLKGVYRGDGTTMTYLGGTIDVIAQDAGASSWSVFLSEFSSPTYTLLIQVGGEDGATINWEATIELDEVAG